MRVGGPYTIQIVYVGGGGAAFAPKTVENVNVNLGVTSDVDVSVEAITVAEEVEVTGVSDPVFASTRTGAATSVGRDDIASLPTISGRLESITRLTPQASGTSFGGQDNRLNNITIDGSYFNNSFGLGAQPGERTNVAPISLESIEQVQVSIAPFDVRQGSFIGAAINSVTRSGTNQFSASVYHRMRDQDLRRHRSHGPDGQSGHVHVPRHGRLGERADHPQQALRLRQLRERGRQAAAAHIPREHRRRSRRRQRERVLASDLNTLSSFLSQSFQYETGAYENLEDLTPAKRYLIRSDFNLNNANKISFRYNQLDSSSANNLSTSSSAGIGRTLGVSGGLHFASSNYTILENIKSGIGEWNTVIGNSMSNNLIVGLTTNDESRGAVDKLFPFVDILQGARGTCRSAPSRSR